MIYWIESHSTPVIAVLVFFFCFLLAAAIFLVTGAIARRAIGAELKAVSPVTLTPLAVILGLLMAFLASRVWENVGHASEYVEREVGALGEVIRFADMLPGEVGGKVRAGIKRHAAFVESNDWLEMAKPGETVYRESPGLDAAMAALLAFETSQPREQLAQQEALRAIRQAFEARRNRIRVSNAEIAPIQWAVVLLLATLILVTTALVHIDSRVSSAVTLFIFATAIAACLVLLMAYDKPFGPGGVTMGPTAFRNIATR